MRSPAIASPFRIQRSVTLSVAVRAREKKREKEKERKKRVREREGGGGVSVKLRRTESSWEKEDAPSTIRRSAQKGN